MNLLDWNVLNAVHISLKTIVPYATLLIVDNTYFSQ